MLAVKLCVHTYYIRITRWEMKREYGEMSEWWCDKNVNLCCVGYSLCLCFMYVKCGVFVCFLWFHFGKYVGTHTHKNSSIFHYWQNRFYDENFKLGDYVYYYFMFFSVCDACVSWCDKIAISSYMCGNLSVPLIFAKEITSHIGSVDIRLM